MWWEKKQIKWIVSGVASLGAAYLIYRLFKDRFPPQKPNDRKQSFESQEQCRLRTVHSNYSQFYFDKEQQLRLIKLKISQKGPTVQQIYLLSPLIIVDEFLKYTKEIRKRRRLIRKVNEEQYIILIRNYEIDVKELLERGRHQVVLDYNMSVENLQKMETAYEMFEDLQDLKKKSGEQLRHKAFSREHLRKIPKDKLRKILEEEISFIRNRMYERLKNKLQDVLIVVNKDDDTGITQEQIYKVITTLCDDIIYEKFGYQREQIQQQLNEVPLLAKDLKKQRQSLFAHIVEFNMDSLEDEDAEVESQPQINSSKGSKTFTLDSKQQSLQSD